MLQLRLSIAGSVYLICAAFAAFGQANLATVRGSIIDEQSLPVQQAQIEVRSDTTGASRKVTLNSQGLFEVPAILPGDYTVAVTSAGFSPLEQHIHLEVGQQMRLDLKLSVGSRTENLNVVAQTEILKTSDASLGEVVETKSIKELPLNGRMLIDLALTVPGSHVGHGAQTGDMNALYWRPGQRSAITIGGNRPNANYFLVDGVTNTDPTFNTQNLSLSPDAVQEFQVQTGSYAAELGGAGGGQINIVTHSGTSQFHGTAYEFLRNNALDARTFNEMSGGSHLVQNNYGGSFGGPVYGKKTFFFVNYEALRLSHAMTMTDTVPTGMEAMGDFSGNGTLIYDPATTRSNPAYDPAKAHQCVEREDDSLAIPE